MNQSLTLNFNFLLYSFGIVVYELLANEYPYPEMDDMDLALQICQGLRPNIDKLLIPQLLKDLIKECWECWSRKENECWGVI